MTQEADVRVCWQCGAPADPGCVYRQSLVAGADQHADGLGYPVKKGRWGKDIVKIAIPRCEACQIRNYVWGSLVFAGLFIGACVGGLSFPSRGLTTILGAIAGGAPAFLATIFHRRLLGLRSLDNYPPLRRLRECGWTDPN
jgi:hypothetical protein